MSNNNIYIRKGVDNLLHRKLGYPDKDYPNSVFFFKKTVSIPYYPALTDVEIDKVITKIKEIIA